MAITVGIWEKLGQNTQQSTVIGQLSGAEALRMLKTKPAQTRAEDSMAVSQGASASRPECLMWCTSDHQ
eukprot:7052969-Ditylum_brightwellii.AAC.1